MSEDNNKSPDAEDIELERKLRLRTKFSLAKAIGRMGGSKLLKGISPVTLKRQAELEIEQYLERHLVDAEGVLVVVLLRRVKNSELLLEMGYEQPLAALTQSIERILDSEERLRQFVNEVDAEWGRIHFERPHFQKEGQPPDPEDPYTFASVRSKLSRLVDKLRLT